AEDLYRFDVEAPAGSRLTDLVPGATVVGVLGYSDSGNYIYFASNADLDAGGPAASGDCAGKAEARSGHSSFSGSCSIYLWRADGAGPCVAGNGCVSFVARSNTDGFAAGGNERSSDGFDWGGNQFNHGMKTARVSADGRILVFRSQRRLTA